ncbi:MAG: CaiB/BaiF CoA-transferase family protein [Caulobacteraceae bacterium]|nr:CaiB/BaiF CoA-transferase family protein [Caulobacteraceae bacterium]
MKLSGLKVLDLSAFLPGPMLTMMMADHGAEVIKVEPPGAGEPTRSIGAVKHGQSVYFRNTQRGKRSIQLDLKAPGDLALCLKLAAEADVLVETWRPGVAERLGLGYAALSALNPRLVYCSISAFGQDGRYAQRPAHDLVIQALAGTIQPGEGPAPSMPIMLSADALSGMTGLSAVLMALLGRERTGQGDRLDISMYDSLTAWTANAVGEVFAHGQAPKAASSRFWGGAALYDLYQTADARWIALGGSEPKFAENLLTGLGRPDLIAAARTPPGEGQAPVRAFLAETFKSKALADWEAWFEGRDVCWAPVRSLAEAYADPFLTQRGMLAYDAEGCEVIGSPIRFAGEPAQIDPHAPEPNEHGPAIAAHGWERPTS